MTSAPAITDAPCTAATCAASSRLCGNDGHPATAGSEIATAGVSVAGVGEACAADGA